MNSIAKIAKNIGIQHNVTIRIIDEPTGRIVQEHVGHNAATNTLVTGIGHFLMGEGVFTDGELLRQWIPQYISLGTMGLGSQEEDAEGLPLNLGGLTGTEEERFTQYLHECPGFGSDGYNTSMMNGRLWAGLGPTFANRRYESTIDCELISDTFPRSKITYREVLPEHQAELSKTIDVVYSAMISTGALAQFREAGKGYIFVSEVGLWSRPDWNESGENGMLAGYRIAPPDRTNWDMTDAANRHLLKTEILKIGTNQIAQVIWKIQLGGIEQLVGLDDPTDEGEQWIFF